MSNFNLFKTVFGNVAVMAKAMDNNIDKFCHAVLANLKEHYDFDTLTEEGEFEEFKEKVLVKAFDVFADFKMKVKKPKEEEEENKKKRTTGFILFNLEKREKIIKENKDAKFEEVGKLVGDAWKTLSEEEKEEYNKKAAKSNGVEYKKPVIKEKQILPTCEHDGCAKKVKSESINGVYLCAEHKKAKQEKKPIKVCSHVKKGGIRCSTTVKEEQDFCSKHKEKSSSKSPEPRKEEKKENTVSKTDKKEKKENTVSKTDKKEEVSTEDKAKAKLLKKCKFDFVKEKPVNVNSSEFWVTKGVKGSSDRVHEKTGLVLSTKKDDVFLVGLTVDGDLYEEEELPEAVLNWVESCKIITSRKKKVIIEDEEDLELEESDDESVLAELEDDE
jgi:hypothetical protein